MPTARSRSGTASSSPAGGWDLDLWDQLLDRHDGDMEAAYDALGRTGQTAPRAGDTMDSAMDKWAAELRTLGS